MAKKSINQFMWAFQHIFRRSVGFTLRQSLQAISDELDVEPAVFLIGVLGDGGSRLPLCVEPEDGPVQPGDFDGLGTKARKLYSDSPGSQMQFTDARMHRLKHQEFRDRAYGEAIKEVLENKLALRFFVSLPTVVEQHKVFVAVGVPQEIVENSAHLIHDQVDDRYPVTRSLAYGVIDEVLKQCNVSLYYPDASSLATTARDVVKTAGARVTYSAAMLTGTITGGQLFDSLNRLATTPYESRIGVGSILLVNQGSEFVNCSLRLHRPVHISDTRALRKLLETSRLGGESMLTDGEVAFGLGRHKSSYPESSESLFHIVVTGNGTWELRHCEKRLLSVEFGDPRLPVPKLRVEQLEDVCLRVFGDIDRAALWAVAQGASKAAHGTMLVISDSAEAEAVRLGKQAFRVRATDLNDACINQVTAIDGAVLVDPFGRCHAIGVILDGLATADGDRSRGSRYNSAVRYLASLRARSVRAVVLLVSEDGMINLLPEMHPRIRRADLDELLADLRAAAAREPVDAERFYTAYRRVEAKSFYLSGEQVEEVKELLRDHWERRQAGGASFRLVEKPLAVNPEMNDEYFLD